MGTDFYLACQDCCEFISLHKWPVLKDAAKLLINLHRPARLNTDKAADSQYRLLDLETNCPIIQTPAAQITAAAETCTSSQEYIQALIPLVAAFATDHQVHTLFLACDIGDLPWNRLDLPDFATWKEQPGPCYETPYLPRNLIEVHAIQTWDQALALIAQQHAWLLHPQLKDDLVAIRVAFEKQLEA